MTISHCASLVLAAGKGTRMHSSKPKVLHTLLGTPMLAYVLKALEPIFENEIFIVAGHKAELLKKEFEDRKFILQKEQLGTGHALMTAFPELSEQKIENLLVINGDTPLVSTEALSKFLEDAKGADIAFTTLQLSDPASYGRVIRSNDQIIAIVEAKDYSESKYGTATGEVNGGIYYMKLSAIRELLPLLTNTNKSGEFYITDLIGLAIKKKLDVRGIACGSDPALFGINSPRELAEMENIIRRKICHRFLDRGVTIHYPDQVVIGPLAGIEPGVEISGPCEIYGATNIAKGAVIDSNCVIIDSDIAPGAHIHHFSFLDRAKVGEKAEVGPYARLRPGAVLEPESHVGNFVELKKARLGCGSKANHLSYLGDCEIGPHVNIGAGTITCNYDGKNKFKTEIGANAFIGSNSSLVAPVSIGRDALIGAGSVITENVEPDGLAIARQRQVNLKRKKH